MKAEKRIVIFSTQHVLPVTMGTAYSIVDMATALVRAGYETHLIMRQERLLARAAYDEAARRGFYLHPTRSDFLALKPEDLLDRRLRHALGPHYPGYRKLEPKTLDSVKRESECGLHPWYRSGISPDVAEEVSDLLGQIDPQIMIVSYAHCTPLFSLLPDVSRSLKVVLTIDIFQERMASFRKYGLVPGVAMSSAEEKHFLQRADMAVAIVEKDRKTLEALAPGLDVVTCGISFPVSDCADFTPASHRAAIVSGAVDHAVHGTRRFLREVWPRVLEKVSDARLDIIGELAQHVEGGDGVTLRGYSPSLREALADIPMMINPVSMGSGLKISTMEALALGKAVVTTQVAASSLPLQDVVALCETDDDLVDKICLLFSDGQAMRSLQRSALDYARQHLNSDVVYAEFLEYLGRHG